MIKLLVVCGVIFVFVIPSARCLVFNLHNVVFYCFYDVIDYFVKQKWKVFNEYGIDMFIGMFGHGKTLSMTHYVRKLYQRYGDSICIISNYKLFGIPYVPLQNFNQLLRLGEEHQGYQGYVVLIDEIEAVLSNRNYADFPLALLSPLCQQRKLKIKIFCSAQRFFMVDKIFRSITTRVVDCNKFWRLQSMRFYDAWDYENAMNTQLLKPYGALWWFVRNKDFRAYSTEQQITEDMCKNFISNDVHLARLGLDNVVNEQAISRKSKSLKRERRARKH